MEGSFGIDTVELEGMLSGLRFTSLEENIEAFSQKSGIAPIVQIFNDAGEAYQKAGLIEKAVSGPEYFDSSFLEGIK
jgi:hypothetical protein